MSQVGPEIHPQDAVLPRRKFRNISRRTIVISVCVVLVIAVAILLSAVFISGSGNSTKQGAF